MARAGVPLNQSVPKQETVICVHRPVTMATIKPGRRKYKKEKILHIYIHTANTQWPNIRTVCETLPCVRERWRSKALLVVGVNFSHYLTIFRLD